MKKELLHFIEWKKIPEEKVESTLADAVSWGVKNLVAHPRWFRDGSERYVDKMAKRLQNFGLRATACHALWGEGNDFIQFDENIRLDMIRRHQAFLDELSALNVSTYTVHLGWFENIDPDRAFEVLRRTVDAMLPAAEKNGITLALENSGEAVPVISRLADMVKAYNSKSVGLCFDAGHANCYQNSVKNTLEIMRDGIVTCHLHDNYGSFDDHNPPGDGNMDWQELNNLLDSLPNMHHAETESGYWDHSSWQKFCTACGK
jgi:sugar phosphate isomerase/epimerase